MLAAFAGESLPGSADLSELKAAADRLAEALTDVDEEELVKEFEQMRRSRKGEKR